MWSFLVLSCHSYSCLVHLASHKVKEPSTRQCLQQYVSTENKKQRLSYRLLQAKQLYNISQHLWGLYLKWIIEFSSCMWSMNFWNCLKIVWIIYNKQHQRQYILTQNMWYLKSPEQASTRCSWFCSTHNSYYTFLQFENLITSSWVAPKYNSISHNWMKWAKCAIPKVSRFSTYNNCLLTKPAVLNFVKICSIWHFQFKWFSIYTPKKLVSGTSLTVALLCLVINCERRKCEGENLIILVFIKLHNRWFALNDLLVLSKVSQIF